jgi:hypothetical protein
MDPVFASASSSIPLNVSVADFEGYIHFKILDNIAYPGFPYQSAPRACMHV